MNNSTKIKSIIAVFALQVFTTLTPHAQGNPSANGTFISGSAASTMSFQTTVGSTVTERMRINSSDGYVGIGIPSPLQRLHVNGNVYAVGGLYTTTGLMGTITAVNVSIRTNNTERIFILNATGHVGIGITPTERLHVSGNILGTGSIAGGDHLSSKGLYTVNHAIKNFTLRLNATDRLTVLNTNGNVGVGRLEKSK